MYKIGTLNNISPKGLIKFNDQYKIAEEIDDVNAILVRSYKMHDMELPESLEAIARAGAGVNNIPIQKCAQKGIVVFNTPGANANAVKELVLSGLLLSSRKIARAIEWTNTLSGKGAEVGPLVEKEKKKFAGSEIKGKTLGVIGMGAIGVMVANSASALGMNVIGFDPYMSVKSALELSRKIKLSDSLDELISQSDYISIHVPMIEETKHMINKEKFALMKENTKLLNFARGELINDDDLIEAINAGIISRYVTDFPNDKLLNLENVICIPHLGASTPESEENCAIMAVEELKDYLENGNITNSVNYPNCSLGKCKTAGRIAILHKNVPSIIGKITNVFANNINISDMNNRSKNEVAYTLIDLDTEINEDIVKEIKSIEDIIKVRIIK